MELRYNTSRTIPLVLVVAEDFIIHSLIHSFDIYLLSRLYVRKCRPSPRDVYQYNFIRCWNIERLSYQLFNSHCLESFLLLTQVHCLDSREIIISTAPKNILKPINLPALVPRNWHPCSLFSSVRKACIPARKISHVMVVLWYWNAEIHNAHSAPWGKGWHSPKSPM